MAQTTLGRTTSAPAISAPRKLIRDLLMLLEIQRDPAYARRPVSTLALDWMYTILSLLMTVGLWMDIWSHNEFGPDQSVLNEYHMLFYGAGAAMGGLLAFVHFKSLGARLPWVHSLPRGYGYVAMGLLIFGVAGVFDLIGHALFGFETSTEALLSPSHIGLFIGWFIISTGAVRAALNRQGQEKLNLVNSLPILIGIAGAMSALTTIILYGAIIGNAAHAVQEMRPTREWIGHTLGLMGQFVQTGIFAGLVIWLVAHFRLPAGAITILYLLYSGLMFIFSQMIGTVGILLIAGVLTDALYTLLHPSQGERLRLRVFGYLLPVILWGTYYLFYIITGLGGGVWFTPYIWIGSVVQSGFIGFFIAYWMTADRPALGAEVKAS
jgi:hypothetical protein